MNNCFQKVNGTVCPGAKKYEISYCNDYIFLLTCELISHMWEATDVIGSASWWRHQMETYSALLAICAGNSPVPGEFHAQSPLTRSFDVFFDLHLNKRLSGQSWGWWFETLLRPLWRHCDVHRGNCSFKKMIRYLTLIFKDQITHMLYITQSYDNYDSAKLYTVVLFSITIRKHEDYVYGQMNYPVLGSYSWTKN